MKPNIKRLLGICYLLCSLLAPVSLMAASDAKLSQISLPAGFTIETLPFEVPNARQMALTDNGTLIVGTRREGKVYAVPDALNATAPEVLTVAKRLTMPSGVAISDGDLYIAATHEVLRVNDIEQNLNKPKLETITDDLPTERHHGWKYIKFGPEGQLFVPVGAPCNICLSKDPRFASLLRMDVTTGTTTLWAQGLRNTVGFDWHPQSGDLWISDNGRDMLGDDVPPEEINVADEAGYHFGYPFVHADDIEDPKFGRHKDRSKHLFTPPKVKIQAHSAALGMAFYTAEAFPPDYKHALFVAEHGSWNRSEKVGYQVSMVTQDEDGAASYTPFAQGWLQGEKNWGRPNDVLVTPNGDLLVSDDQRGVIYRIRYQPSS